MKRYKIRSCHSSDIRPNGWALTPLLIFLAIYLVVSIIVNDFYKVPITIAFTISSIYALFISKGGSMDEKLSLYSKGAANKNIMQMIWIFVMAGIFAQSAKAMGAIDAAVNISRDVMPGNLILAGIFIASCFISFSIGTSVGTIVALTPVAVGIAEKTGVSIPFILGIIVGGAFYGDNLSFISDTTIAATRSMECRMKDKFVINSRIVTPAAFLVLIIYVFKGMDVCTNVEAEAMDWIKSLPYFIVLVLAAIGIDVMLVLFFGILAVLLIGMLTGSIDIWTWFASAGEGVKGMGELIIITMMAGGMLELIRANGGIAFIITRLTRHVKSKRGAELSIAGLVSLANVCTANNTIAIITTGPIARDIATRYSLDKRKCACILDTFSCLVQGILPYGAQMLMAAGLAHISPASIIPYLFYPMTMGLFTLLCIIFRLPRKYS